MSPREFSARGLQHKTLETAKRRMRFVSASNDKRRRCRRACPASSGTENCRHDIVFVVWLSLIIRRCDAVRQYGGRGRGEALEQLRDAAHLRNVFEHLADVVVKDELRLFELLGRD